MGISGNPYIKYQFYKLVLCNEIQLMKGGTTHPCPCLELL